jgi:hypothetical protein
MLNAARYYRTQLAVLQDSEALRLLFLGRPTMANGPVDHPQRITFVRLCLTEHKENLALWS